MIFMEKFHSCYRDGLDGRRDMRPFSGIYFFLEIALALAVLSLYDIFYFGFWFFRGTFFLITAVLIALTRPYKKMYMNICDTLLLSYLAIICYMFSLNTKRQNFIPLVQFIVIFPFVTLVLVILFKLLHTFFSSYFFRSRWESFTRLMTARKTNGRVITNQRRNNMNMYGAI